MTAPIEMGKFVGAPVRTQAFDGVSIAESTYAEGQRVAAHAHDEPLLSLVLQGHATEAIDGRTREVGAQTLLYTPSYATHEHRYLTPGRWLNIQFSSAWFSRIGDGRLRLPNAPLLLRSHPAVS